MMMGLLLIVAALLLSAYNLYESHKAEQSVNQIMEQLNQRSGINDTEGTSQSKDMGKAVAVESSEIEIPDYILNPNMEMPVENIGGINYIGIISIPSYHIELPVISSWSYENLQIAPCRYEGSIYTNNIVIAAHNYSSHFWNIQKLVEGDKVIFTDIDGNEFTYVVAARETLMPTAVEEMTSGEWDLTLFTCTLGGAYRVTVRCESEVNQ